MLDRISLGRFLCLSGFLWLLYGLNGAWDGVRLGLSVHSNCTVTTLSNLEMPYTVMVLTIALYHSGVGAVVSPVSFYISPSYVCFLFFFTLFLINRVLRPCLLIPSSSSFTLASMLQR